MQEDESCDVCAGSLGHRTGTDERAAMSTSPAGSNPDARAELASRLALVVGRLNRRMLRGGQGLSHGVLSALASIVKFGPLRLGDLAARELVAAATVTRMISDLENRGLVQREVDPSDRRAFMVEATPEGYELILRARSARADVIAELLDGAGERDVALILGALESLEGLIDDGAAPEVQPVDPQPAEQRSVEPDAAPREYEDYS
jgi:DNA-binding MarR family transcriptional regulator